MVFEIVSEGFTGDGDPPGMRCWTAQSRFHFIMRSDAKWMFGVLYDSLSVKGRPPHRRKTQLVTA